MTITNEILKRIINNILSGQQFNNLFINSADQCDMYDTTTVYPQCEVWVIDQIIEKLDKSRVDQLLNKHAHIIKLLDTYPRYKRALDGRIYYIDCLQSVLREFTLTEAERISLTQFRDSLS